jgi:hypothetical protein
MRAEPPTLRQIEARPHGYANNIAKALKIARRPSTGFSGNVPATGLRSRELHNKVASRRPWPLFASRGGWLRIPVGWTVGSPH